METRTLSRGNIEAYNKRIRIRLETFPDQDTALVTIYQLKPNGYHHAKHTITVKQPITIEALIQVYDAFAKAA